MWRRRGSRWSLWSDDSFLSIGSKGSVLSIGSVGSALSIGSAGGSASVLSIGSFLSIGAAVDVLPLVIAFARQPTRRTGRRTAPSGGSWAGDRGRGALVNGPIVSAPNVGSILAERYELVRHIARGGMGDVYEADDHQLKRRVAVKVFRAAAPGDRARFDGEVVVLAALNHPGLVQVYDAGEHGGDAFVVLELVDGPTLASRLADDGPIPATEVASVGGAVADALAFIHERGVVHRDVTPANVLCGSDGRPRLADFGIARLVDTTRITAVSTAVGTAAYMAPEQVQGHDVTPAADVYALGLVLLELLTGRRGFTGSPQEVAVARLVRAPDTATGVPDAWRPLLARMTNRAPANRPAAADVRDRLAALVDSAAAGTGALAVAAAVVVAPPDGQPAASGDALTRPLERVEGGTTVMPAALAPDYGPTGRPGSPAALGRRRAVVVAIVGLVLLLGAVAAASDRDLDMPTPTSTVTEPVVAVPSSTTTVAPTTTTETPPEDHEGNGKGKGNDGEEAD